MRISRLLNYSKIKKVVFSSIMLTLCTSNVYAREAQGDISAALQGHVAFQETNVGAHYYVQSTSSNIYKKAHMVVNLSGVQLNTVDKTRIAYVSFSVCGVDMGLKNDGTGWSSYYVDFKTPRRAKWCGNENFKNVGKVSIYVRAVKENGVDKIRGYYVFYDKNSKEIKKTLVECVAPLGMLFQNSVSFTRFVSLIPNHGEVDIPDYSYIRDVKITNVSLMNPVNDNSIPWGITSKQTINAWVTQQWNIKVTRTQLGENCTISHEFSYPSQRMPIYANYVDTRNIPLSRAHISGDVGLAKYLRDAGRVVVWDSTTGNILINGKRLSCAHASGISIYKGCTFIPERVAKIILQKY